MNSKQKIKQWLYLPNLRTGHEDIRTGRVMPAYLHWGIFAIDLLALASQVAGAILWPALYWTKRQFYGIQQSYSCLEVQGVRKVKSQRLLYFLLFHPAPFSNSRGQVGAFMVKSSMFRDQAVFKTKTLGVTGGLRLLDKRIFAEKHQEGFAYSKVILVWKFKGLGRLKVRDSCTFFCLTPPLSQILKARCVSSWLRGKEQYIQRSSGVRNQNT